MGKLIKDSEQIIVGISETQECFFVGHKDVTTKPITVSLDALEFFMKRLRQKIIFARKQQVKLGFTKWEQVVA